VDHEAVALVALAVVGADAEEGEIGLALAADERDGEVAVGAVGEQSVELSLQVDRALAVEVEGDPATVDPFDAAGAGWLAPVFVRRCCCRAATAAVTSVMPLVRARSARSELMKSICLMEAVAVLMR
jgi:hypothetical protein